MHHHGGAKETVVSLLIAFTLALVFRGVVLEPFLIPTGSMAPTLLGAHVRVEDPATGYHWTVGPWNYVDHVTQQVPASDQKVGPVRDPMTLEALGQPNPAQLKLRGGDRIFVLKFLYPLLNPDRWDVVVFRNPRNPQENYIKRLLGLPGEQLALIDGDVFTRPLPADLSPAASQNAWDGSDQSWRIQRKPERVQRAVWQPVFDSRFTPPNPVRDGTRWFRTPWLPTGAGWDVDSGATYSFKGNGTTALSWDHQNRPIDDWTFYNEIGPNIHNWPPLQPFPVSDVRLRASITPTAAVDEIGALIAARGHEFRLSVRGAAGTYTAEIAMRAHAAPPPVRSTAQPAVPGGATGEWQKLATVENLSLPFTPGQAAAVEFWHVDQSLAVYVGGRRIAEAEYDWKPRERIEAATGLTLEQALKLDIPFQPPLAKGINYQPPTAAFTFSGGPFTLSNVALDRDLFYRPVAFLSGQSEGRPTRGSHPINLVDARADEFFVCGDNSAASDDARMWTDPDGWVQAQIDPHAGVVPRDLLVGKAFCVFLPSVGRMWGDLPVPNLGDVRWIW